LEGEYLRAPADYAYIAEQYATAVQTLELLKARLDCVRAATRMQLRKLRTEEEARVPSERRLDAEIEADAEVQNIRAAVAAATGDKTALRGLLDAISMKRDMLVNLGAHARQERKLSGLAP
jgi:hypothetical protein